MFRTPAALLTVIVMLSLSTSALAGGWATVRLDEEPTGLVAGTPWQFGFMVLQHGVTPNSDVSPVVRAIHRETGEVATAVARQDGPPGHFVAELTLPRAGEWQWSIAPQPFAETSFTSLVVRDKPVDTAPDPSASIRSGSCANPGEVRFTIGKWEGAAGVAAIRTPTSLAAPLERGERLSAVGSRSAVSMNNPA